MKEFFKNPINILGTIAIIMILLFIIIFAIATYNMLIDHYCTTEIPVTDAIKDPKCKPYFR